MTVWAAGVELVIEELAGGDLLPGTDPRLRRRVAAAGDPGRARGGGGSGSVCRSADRPRSSSWRRTRSSRIVDATQLLVDQQDVTPLGLAYQAIELQSTEDPLDAALRRVLRAMKVWGMARSSTSTSTTRSRARRPGSGRRARAKVALVLPAGSRLATSRINFRLLARRRGSRTGCCRSSPPTRPPGRSPPRPACPSSSIGDYEAVAPPLRSPAPAAPPGAAGAPRRGGRGLRRRPSGRCLGPAARGRRASSGAGSRASGAEQRVPARAARPDGRPPAPRSGAADAGSHRSPSGAPGRSPDRPLVLPGLPVVLAGAGASSCRPADVELLGTCSSRVRFRWVPSVRACAPIRRVS